MNEFSWRVERRYSSQTLPAAAILCTVLFCLVSIGAKTRSDFNSDARFSAFKKFAFVAGIDLGKTGLMNDPDTRTRIAHFVRGILRPRNWKVRAVSELGRLLGEPA